MRLIVDLDSGKTVAGSVCVADSFWRRFLGLMGKRRMLAGEALLLLGCPSVHTFFMRFPIDVAYLDSDMRVLAVLPGVKPWRIVRGVRSGVHTLELAEGVLASAAIVVGHKLSITHVAQ